MTDVEQQKQDALAHKETMRDRMLAIALEEGLTEAEFEAQFDDLYAAVQSGRIIGRTLELGQEPEEKPSKAKASRFRLRM